MDESTGGKPLRGRWIAARTPRRRAEGSLPTRRWIWRGLLAVVLLVVASLLAAWWFLRGSLPTLDGAHALPGLSAPISIQRDALGVVTIDAANETDAMRALGYVHAQERYFEMDLMRRVPAGELSALFGGRALDVDRRNRMHRMRARVDASLATIAGERLPQLQAYTEGANAGRSALRVRPWPYFLLGREPEPWTAADSALTGFAMYFDLQDASNARELALWKLRPHLAPALYNLLVRDGTRWDAPLMGTARGDATLPDAGTVDLRRLPAPESGTPVMPATDGAPGSNNFAVSGALTADGRSIVADDMHLGLRAPNIWFRARLRYPDARAPDGRVDVSGFTLPGLPAVIVGSNTHVAWGFTNSYVDSLDWSRVRPCAGGATSACDPVVRHKERIVVAGGPTETLVVDETAWGPILETLPGGDRLALRWTAHLPGALDFGLAGFARARDIDDALAIADRTGTPTQNLVIGDRDGAIAWRLLGPLAMRGEACSRRAPVANVDRAGLARRCMPWPIDTSASPVVRSPQATRLWTANSRVVDGEALERIGDGGAAFAARAHQIRAGLDARTRFTERDLLAIQLDDRALFLQDWWRLLLHEAGPRTARQGSHSLRSAALDTAPASTAPSALQALAAASSDWDGRASPDSTGYRLVRAWRLAVHARILDGLTAPAQAAMGADFVMPDVPQFEGVVWPLVQQRPAHLLPRRFACATVAPATTRNGTACGWAALFEDAAREVRDELAVKGALADRTWGERNTAAICHPLAGAIPLLGKRLLCMPADALPGDGAMPRVQGPGFGASQRMVVAPGHEADGIAHMPGGQSGHPLSPFWGAGHGAWVRGTPSAFLPGKARHTLRLSPPAAKATRVAAARTAL